MQLFLFLFPLQHIKRPALQNKQVVVLRMAFRARKVLGTFEKRAPAQNEEGVSPTCVCKVQVLKFASYSLWFSSHFPEIFRKYCCFAFN